MNEKTVLCKKSGSVTEIVLNRPEALNALNKDLILGLIDALETVQKDAECRVLVLRGAGRCFSSGGDIKFFKSQMDSNPRIPVAMPDQLHEAITLIRALSVPVLASVQGSAGGAGTSLLLACDLVVCSDDAKLNLAYCRIGLSPDGGSTYFLPRHVGLKKAMAIFLNSEPISASSALNYGLVNYVVPSHQLESSSKAVAEKLAKGPTQAFARTKKLLNESFNHTLDQQLKLESQLISDSSTTNDFKEGISAFLEKRSPNYKGN